MYFDKNWLLNTEDQAIFRTPHWRDHSAKLAANALMAADSARTFTKAAHNRLLFHVARMPDAEALAAYRRHLVLMDAFTGLSPADRDALEGKLTLNERAFLTGDQEHAKTIERRRQVQNSAPALAEYFGELHAEAARVAEDQRKAIEAHNTSQAEAAQAWVDAPGIVLVL